jgi:hypothetical protein
MTASCRRPCASITVSLTLMSRWNRSVSSTKSPPARWQERFEIGVTKWAPRDHWNAYYRPGGWGCRVALTHALIFYCCYCASLVSPNIPWGISITCAKEESKVLQCFKHSLDRTFWHTERLEDHRCHWVADSIVAVVGVHRG